MKLVQASQVGKLDILASAVLGSPGKTQIVTTSCIPSIYLFRDIWELANDQKARGF